MGMYTKFNVFIGETRGEDIRELAYYVDGYDPTKNNPNDCWELITTVDALRIVDTELFALYDVAKAIAEAVSAIAEEFPVSSYVPERYGVNNGLLVDVEKATTLSFKLLSDGERIGLSRHLIGFLKKEVL